MATFVLVPGAGGSAWYWHRVTQELHARGHDALAVELPGADQRAGLPDYADIVVEAVADHHDAVLVAQSLGGFTAPLVCARVAVRQLVLVNAMVPLPGETPGDWWANTGAVDARIAAAEVGGYSADFDEPTYFLHDVPAAVQAEGAAYERSEADIVFGQRCTFDTWPDIPIRVLIGRGDRFFPASFQHRIARERLGLHAEETSGGHLVALAHPVELADRLESAPTGSARAPA